MNEYKIEVANEAESKEVQELFFELGYEWLGGGKSVRYTKQRYLFADESYRISFATNQNLKHFNESLCQQITLPELRILAMLKRNDVSDATHLDEDGDKWFISGGEYYFFDCDDEWLRVDEWAAKTCEAQPIKKKEKDMSNLISGKEAKLAWANDEEVQVKDRSSSEWNLIDGELHLKIFDSECLDFRLKPQKITVTLELPKPFKPDVGDTYWHVLAGRKAGYSWAIYDNDLYDQEFTQFGAYRTEEEVKQVVEALRAAALEALKA